MGSTEKEIQTLQKRVTELEQQLAEAQAALRTFSSSGENEVQGSCSQQRAEELNAIIQTLHDPVLVYDQNGVIYLANASAIRAHGFDPIGYHRRETNETLMVRSPTGEVVHSDDLPSARALKGEIVIDEELIITNSHGQELTILVTSSPLTVNDVLKGAMSVWHDVTAQRQAEKAKELALAQAEEGNLLLEALLEFIPEGICITGGAPDFSIKRVSRYGLEMTGNLDPARIVGLPASQHQTALGLFRADGVTPFSPEETPLYRASHFGEITFNEQMVIRTQDDVPLPILMIAAPIRNTQGQIIAAINSWRDFTAIKQLEENLRSARDRAMWLARLPGENPNPVVRISDVGIVLYHNPPATNLPGWMCLTNEPVPMLLRGLVQKALTQGEPVEEEVELGKKIYLVSVAPIPNERYANLYGRDITEQKKVEEALRTNEAKYRSLVETAFEGVWAVDTNGRTTFINRRMAEMLKYDSVSELMDRSAFDFVPPEDLDELKAKFKIRMDKDDPEQYDVRLRCRDGSMIWASAASNNVMDENGVLTGRMALFIDITKRKQAEEALQKSEDRFAKAFHASPNAVLLSRLSDGLIMEVNEGWSTILGYKPDEVIGKTTLELDIYVNPQDRQDFIARLKNDGFLRDVEVQIRRKSGEIRQASMSFEQIEINGEDCLLAIIRDITAQKQSEQALRESEARFRSLADSLPQLLWTARADGTVDYYNSRYLEYQDIKQVAGEGWEWAPVLHPEDVQPTIDAWQRSVATGEIYQIEHRVQMTNGSYRWHLSRGVPVLDENGKVIRWFGTATDIHDTKMAEEQLKVYAERLERSNRELEQFAFMASHDLQEPLRKIEVFGDLLLESSKSLSGRERNYLDRMRDAAKRMRDMVDGLLQLSRVTTQGKPFTQVNLSKVIEDVLYDLETQLRRTNGKVEVGTFPTVEGDSLQLRQLMQNLIGNALKYHQPNVPPEIKVHAQQLSDKVQIYVEDHGIGFNQEDAERVFHPFQRLVGRSQYEGSGMGLAICRRIVERHGGEMTAHSQPGQGATFTVVLPVYQAERARKDLDNERSGAASDRRG